MLARRRLFDCALSAAAVALVASPIAARAQAGFSRTILQQADHPGDRHATLLVRVDIDAGAVVARHGHPGVESGYLVAGEVVLRIAGKPDQTLRPGDSYLIPAGTPHELQNGGAKSIIVATFVVEKDKPLSSPA